jgi:hypothetical protein
MQSGWVNAGKDGVVMIPEVTIYKEKCQLKVSVEPPSTFTHRVAAGDQHSSSNLRVFPNPVSSSAIIEFRMLQPGQIKIEIHNISGQLVEVIMDESRPAGHHSVLWDTGIHPSGLFICTFRTEWETVHRELFLSR